MLSEYAGNPHCRQRKNGCQRNCEKRYEYKANHKPQVCAKRIAVNNIVGYEYGNHEAEVSLKLEGEEDDKLRKVNLYRLTGKCQ